MAKLRITYAKSAIGYSQTQKDTIRSLGLRKLNSTVVHEDTPTIRGMAFKVRHLVRVEELGDVAPEAPAPRARTTLTIAAPATESKPARKEAAPAATLPVLPDTAVSDEQGDEEAALAATSAVLPDAAASDDQGDDLERIEGIGPVIAGLLRDAGITTFAQLAETDVASLEAMLRDAKLNLAVADTWPEQAALAAAGNWEEFTRLTDQLKAGKRS
jgi:ribosomal protein L30